MMQGEDALKCLNDACLVWLNLAFSYLPYVPSQLLGLFCLHCTLQVWTNIISAGNELIKLSQSLLDLSNNLYKQQVICHYLIYF